MMLDRFANMNSRPLRSTCTCGYNWFGMVLSESRNGSCPNDTPLGLRGYSSQLGSLYVRLLAPP